MACLDSTLLGMLLGSVQIAGLTSAWLARMSEGSAGQASCQWLFFAMLALMGLATMASAAVGPGYWMTPAGTMAVMILGAIWDFRPYTRTQGL